MIHYILFRDYSMMTFFALADVTFADMTSKLKSQHCDYPNKIKSWGTVETGKWVCTKNDGELDIDATNIMRVKYTV